MLVLSRGVNESIILHTSDGPITVMVCELRRQRKTDQVRLGIDAPQSVKILRSELIATTQILRSELTATTRERNEGEV